MGGDGLKWEVFVKKWGKEESDLEGFSFIDDLRDKSERKKQHLPYCGRNNPLNLAGEYRETTLPLVSS